MQAVPAHDDRGRMFRSAFTADEGHLLVAADYSQVSTRVGGWCGGRNLRVQGWKRVC
jgi:DNA polymerase I-like protein with 3'-5' exonuclease and polymerase domains